MLFHWTIMHEGRGHACLAQVPGKRRGLPVVVWHTDLTAFPA